jgi:SNF2 family DNA or RNA helicase
MKILLEGIKESDIVYYPKLAYKNHVLQNVYLKRGSVKKTSTEQGVELEIISGSIYNRAINEFKACNECDIIMNNVIDSNNNSIDESTREYYNSLLVSRCTELYNYQIRDVIWMKEIESSELKWGCYINEVGLGKTLTLLTLIKSTFDENARNIYKTDSSICNYKYTRMIKAGTFCENRLKKGENLYCNKHNKKSFKWSRIIKSDTSRLNLESNATLIFCPTHICDQWLSEITKYFGLESIRVIMIVNRSCISNITVEEILGADIIIMSHSMISYFENIENIRIVSELQGSELLRDIKFKRVIYDESHELYTKNNRHKTMWIKSKYKWCVSGTPFAKYSTNYYNNIMLSDSWNELKVENVVGRNKRLDSIFEEYDLYSRHPLDYNRIRNHYRRNILENVNHEINRLNKVKDEIIWLNFTRLEKDIYESYKLSIRDTQDLCDKFKKVLLHLCCDPELLIGISDKSIRECKSLKEVSIVILEGNEKRLEILQKRMKSDKSLYYTMNEYYNKLNVDVQEYYTNSIIVAKRNYTESENMYNSQEKLVKYLRQCLNRLQENKQQDTQCGVCLEDYSDDIIILGCGHIYCVECIENMKRMNVNRVCPMCKMRITTKVKYNTRVIESDKTVLYELINKYKSTKIANIIVYIRELLEKDSNEKCIIFSQWDILLHKIGNILENSGIKIEYCEGNIYNKKKSIKRFKEGDSRVILLSSKNAASGLNLVEARNVILIEPIYGDAQYKMNVENQAIGRVNRIGQKNTVNVVRFLIKDTIEQDIQEGKVTFTNVVL